jgi:hypothetical protein
LISRGIFDDFDERMSYGYEAKPFSKYGDKTLTDQFFRTLGRARLYSDKRLEGTELMETDYKGQLEKVFTRLEQKGKANLPEGLNPKIFDPLISLTAASYENHVLQVENDYDFVFKLLSDYWGNLINERSLATLQLPPLETAAKKERGQIESQVKKKIAEYF